VERRHDLRPTSSLRALRDDPGIDQTLQNLLRALTLNLELRARYRVFEFEATQDGHAEIARMFQDLRRSETESLTALMAGLRSRLDEMDLSGLDQPVVD
jgi:rubrerythrin